jgi:hypothetical protein
MLPADSFDWIEWSAFAGMAVLLLSHHWLSRLGMHRRTYLTFFVVAAVFGVLTVVLALTGKGGLATFSFVMALLHLGNAVGQYRSRPDA